MNRITEKQLEAVCARINRATGSPLETYTRQEDGRLKANVGNYHISHAYGGVALHRMSNESGGVTTPFGMGHEPKRALIEKMWAFLAGIEAGTGNPC